jgi:hypothetical protein
VDILEKYFFIRLNIKSGNNMMILNKLKFPLIHALVFLFGVVFGAVGTVVEFEILYSYLQEWHLHPKTWIYVWSSALALIRDVLTVYVAAVFILLIIKVIQVFIDYWRLYKFRLKK